MEKWIERAGTFLLVLFGLLYIGAKIHFFTRYGVLGPGKYLEEHWPFWAGVAVIGGAGACLSWIREKIRRPKSS
jgi:hypothetical protein